MKFFSLLLRAFIALFVVVLLLEVTTLQSGASGAGNSFDGGLHVWTALAAGTVSIDVVVLTAALMFSFTRLGLALKFGGWMAAWHAAFTLLSTGLAVGALAVGRWAFGSESASGAVVMLACLNMAIFLGAAYFIFQFFHSVVRKNAREAELEIGGNVLEARWQTRVFQATILSACFDALYLVKPAMYGGYNALVSIQSIILLGLEVGVVALLGGCICFLLGAQLRKNDQGGRYRFMMRGVMAEYFAFPFFMIWNMAKGLEAALQPSTGLHVGLGAVGIVSLSYSWWYWHTDHQEVQAATKSKAEATAAT